MKLQAKMRILHSIFWAYPFCAFLFFCKEGDAFLVTGRRHLWLFPQEQEQLIFSAKLSDDDNSGYKFGDITRGVVGNFKKGVNSLTGKSKYEFGDLTRWLDKQGRGTVSQWVEGFTNKPNYRFGDLSREVLRRLESGEYTSDDIWLFLKIVAMVGVNLNLQPVISLLPAKVLMELLEVSVAKEVGDRVATAIVQEIQKRLKEFMTGDRNYELGNITKEKLTGSKDYQFGDLTKNAVSKFTGKENYSFGDITRKLLEKKQEGGNDINNDIDASDSLKGIDMDDDTKKAFEEWDKQYIASIGDDLNVALRNQQDLEAWDEQFLSAASKEGDEKPR